MTTFEKFQKPGERFSKKISLWKQGAIHISKGTMNFFSLQGLDFCTLYFDRNGNKVGLQFLGSADVEGAVKLSYRDVGAVIPCKSFLDYYQINYSASRQYLLEQDTETGLLVFDLGAPLTDGYAEHPEGQIVEDAMFVLCAGGQGELPGSLSADELALVGRWLFETAAHLNLDRHALQARYRSLLAHAGKNEPWASPLSPLEKKVYDLLRDHFETYE